MKKILFSLIASTFTAASLISAPQAIVFDFGGVMTGEPNREAVITFIRQSFYFSAEEFEKANQEKRLAVKQGKTDEEFWISYAKNKGINLQAKEVLFVDDRPENIESAKTIGLDAILFESEQQLRNELSRRGVLE